MGWKLFHPLRETGYDRREGRKKKRRRGTGEQRKTDANRHGARGLRKLREARAKKSTNFVPGDVDRAREDDVESMQKRRRYISSEKTMGENEERKKRRKEGRKGEVGGAEEAREGDESIRVSPRSI